MYWRLLFILTLALILINANVVFAEYDISLSVEPNEGTAKDNFIVQLTVSGKFNEVEPPQFKNSPEFKLNFSETLRSTQINNLNVTQQTIFNYHLTPLIELKPGQYELPGGEIRIDGKTNDFGGAKLRIIENSIATSPDITKKNGIDFTQIVDNYEPYIGEQITYRIEVATNRRLSQAAFDDIAIENYWRESYGKKAERSRNISGTIVYSYLEALFANKAGDSVIPERRLTANIEVPLARRSVGGSSFFDSFFEDMDAFPHTKTEPVKLTAEALKIKVKDLPKMPDDIKSQAQGNLNIVVGQLDLKSSYDQEAIKQGEGINLVVEVTSDANLRPLELQPEQVIDESIFKIYEDKAETSVSVNDNRLYFKKIFKIAVIGKKVGKYNLPIYQIISFNPKSATYRIHKTSSKQIEVLVNNQESEKLLLYTNEKAVEKQKEIKEESKEKAIEIFAEDILPLRSGEEIYQKQFSIDNRLFFFSLLLPLIVLAYSYYYTKRLNYHFGNQATVFAKQAYANYIDKIKGDDLDIIKLSSAFRTYFGHKFNVNSESLTPVELRILLGNNLKKTELATQAEEYFLQLQKYLYAGKVADHDVLSELLKESEKLLGEIEKNVV